MRRVGFGDTQDHHSILLSLRQERIAAALIVMECTVES